MCRNCHSHNPDEVTFLNAEIATAPADNDEFDTFFDWDAVSNNSIGVLKRIPAGAVSDFDCLLTDLAEAADR